MGGERKPAGLSPPTAAYEEKDSVRREVPRNTTDQESQQSNEEVADDALNEGLPETQIDNTPEPRRSSRVSRPPTNLQPTMKGQSHSESMHLQVPEESAEEYTNETARHWVSMLQAIKERFTTQARKFVGRNNTTATWSHTVSTRD